MPRSVLTSDFILQEGLKYVGIPVEQQNKRSAKLNWKYFRTHYGAAPTVMAAIWDDLCVTNIEKSKLDESEKGQKGLKCFFMALYFLYVHPKNQHVLATRFGVSLKKASGASLWKWVSRIAGLSEKVIKFPDELNSSNREEFIITVDCRDHKIWEKKHPRYNIDKAYGSKKHGYHASLKYEMAVSIFHDQICWINGPFKASVHDITIFREHGLKQKLLRDYPNSYVSVDRGYKSSEPDEDMLAWPNGKDPLDLKKFKSLSRCREEDVNGRMSKFMCLNREFIYSVDKHKECYYSAAVIIQYQLNCGDAFLTRV